MTKPVYLKFHSNLAQLLDIRLIALAASEPNTPLPSSNPQELLLKVLRLKPESKPHIWMREIYPLLSQASQGLGPNGVPPEVAQILQGGAGALSTLVPSVFDGVRLFLEKALEAPRQRLTFAEPLWRNRGDRASWRVFGEWLLKRGDPRGELIQLDELLEQEGALTHEEKKYLAQRREELEELLSRNLLSRLGLGFIRKERFFWWDHGYLEAATVPVNESLLIDLLESEDAMFLSGLNLYPWEGQRSEILPCFGLPHFAKLTSFGLFNGAIDDEGIPALVSSPHLKGLTSLWLEANQVGDKGMRVLASSPNFTKLTNLRLPDNTIGDEGVCALAKSPHLRGLTSLNLGGNPIGHEGAKALMKSPHLTGLRILLLDKQRINPKVRRSLEAWTLKRGIKLSWTPLI